MVSLYHAHRDDDQLLDRYWRELWRSRSVKELNARLLIINRETKEKVRYGYATSSEPRNPQLRCTAQRKTCPLSCIRRV